MLSSKYTQKRTPSPPREQEDEEVKVKQLESAPAEAEPMEQGKPYQASVESEARKYWQSLAHHAVADVVQHVREQGWTNRPLSEAYDSPTYIDALIQLARDANWLVEEIPLPGQPPIRYTLDARTNTPVPEKDSFIHCRYLSHLFGSKLQGHSRIYPWMSSREYPQPHRGRLDGMGLPACYTLHVTRGRRLPFVMIHYQRAGQLRPAEDRRFARYTISYDQPLRSEPLENLLSASMRIAMLKDSNLSEGAIETAINAIRSEYDLLEPNFPPQPPIPCVIS